MHCKQFYSKLLQKFGRSKVSRVQNDNKTFFWPKRADNRYEFCFLEKTNVCVDLGYLICERCERKRVFACVGMCSFTCLQKHASVYVYPTCFWIDRTEPTVNPSSPPHLHTADQSCHRLCRFLSSRFSRVCCSNLLLITESQFGLMAQPCDLFVFAFQSHGGHTDHSFSLLKVQTTLSWFHFEWPKQPPHSLADAPKQTAKATACCCLKDWMKEGEGIDLNTWCSTILPEIHTFPEVEIENSIKVQPYLCSTFSLAFANRLVPTASNIKCCQISRCPISAVKNNFL